MPDLGDELRRAAGGGTHAYDIADIRRTATRRTRVRRAGAATLAAVALVGGIGLALRDDETSAPLETVDDPDPTVTTTSEALPDPDTTDPIADDPIPTTPECGEARAGLEPVPDDLGADLDGDGRADRFHTVRADDEGGGSWIQLERSSDASFTSPLRLVGLVGPGGPLDAADIDDDGTPEVFFSLSGNTAITGVLLDVDGCDLTAVTTDSPGLDDGDGVFTYLHAAGGNSCAPTGCRMAVTCAPGTPTPTIVVTSMFPTPNALDPGFDHDEWELLAPADRPIRFTQEEVRIVDGATVSLATIDEVTTVGEVDLWFRRDGVECSSTLEGEACGLLPPPDAVVDGWTMGENTFWTEVGGGSLTWRRDDGAVVLLRSPATASTGDEIATLTIVGRPAVITAPPSAGPAVAITWSESTGQPSATCETWSLASADLAVDDLTDFADAAFGISDLRATVDALPARLTDDEIFAFVEDFVREISAFDGEDKPPPDLSWAAEVRRFVGAEEAPWATAAEMRTWAGWEPTTADGSAITRSDYEAIWGGASGAPLTDVCGITAPPLPADLDDLQPVRITPHLDAPCADWLIVELFLRTDHSNTIEAIRVLGPATE